MKYLVKDFVANIQADKLEAELNKLADDGFKILSCDYVKHDYTDFNKMPAFKSYFRVIGEKNLGKSLKSSQLLKG